MRRLCTVLGCALLVVALAAPAARGELVAAYEHAGAGGDLDIAVVVALTGEPITLPAGVNTAADEFHPSLSGDGRYLVFERATPAGVAYANADANVARSDPLPSNEPASQPDKQVIMVDLHTGAPVQPTPLLIADRKKVTPSISTDAHWVIHGSTTGGGPPTARMSVFDVSAAPAVPPEKQFDRTDIHNILLNPTLGTGDRPALVFSTLNESGGAELPLGIVPAIDPSGGGVQQLGPAQGVVELDRGTDRGDNHAAILSNRFVAYDQVPFSNATGWNGDADIHGYDIATGQPVTLAPGLNTGGDERMPAWSADGRYLAFIHHRPADQGDDLLVYDFATGQFVNAIPTNLGRNPADSAAGVFRRLEGNLSIADDPTLTRQVIIVGFVTVVCTYVPVGATTPPPKGGAPITIDRVSYVQKCTLRSGIRVAGTTVKVGFLVQRIV